MKDIGSFFRRRNVGLIGIPAKRRLGGRLLLSCLVLAAGTLPSVGGCGRFWGSVQVDNPVRDFLMQVKSRRGRAFERVESARKGKGPFDVQVVLKAGGAGGASEEKDVLTLARAWVGVIQPVDPQKAWVEFVDSEGQVVAWGMFLVDKGIYVGFGPGPSK
ncbi:MAG: hypothetical protein ACE5JS_06885 [Nitrospinota bacterium]